MRSKSCFIMAFIEQQAEFMAQTGLKHHPVVGRHLHLTRPLGHQCLLHWRQIAQPLRHPFGETFDVTVADLRLAESLIFIGEFLMALGHPLQKLLSLRLAEGIGKLIHIGQKLHQQALVVLIDQRLLLLEIALGKMCWIERQPLLQLVNVGR